MVSTTFMFMSIVLSIVFIFLSYFGIVRYITIYCKSFDSYIENYRKIKAPEEKVIVIIFNSKKNSNIKNVIKSILDQTVKVNSICVYTPNEKNIPENIKKIAQVNVIDAKYNNLGGVISVLSTEGNADTNIISLQDDSIYGIDTLELLLEQSKKDPYKLVHFKQKDFTKGILFKPKFFDSKILEYDGKSSLQYPNKSHNFKLL